MKPTDLNTYAENTWCLGCGNFGILSVVKSVISDLVNEGSYRREQFTMVTGVGCHGKTFDYIDINGFYGLHGRVLPVALGIKFANPELVVIGFAGDGDTYAEGAAHFINVARYNPDITLLVHNNQLFALTTGQATPTSVKGWKGKSTPFGKPDEPMNPLLLALYAGATFVARVYSMDVKHFKYVLKEAIRHKGFAFIDVLQPCVTYFNTVPFYSQHVYHLEDEGHDPTDFEEAVRRAREWDYNVEPGKKVATGIFYRTEKPIFEEQYDVTRPFWKRKRDIKWKDVVNEMLVTPP